MSVDLTPREPVDETAPDRPRFRRRQWVTIAALVLVLGSLTGWALEHFGALQPPSGQSVDSEALGVGVTVIPVAERTALPALTGTTLTGEPWSLANERGHVVVFNVWASWCAPCRAEAPILAAIAERTAAAGVHFVGINIRDDTTSALAFERRFGITYPSLSDHDGRLLLQIRDLPAAAIPSTMVVDAQGRQAGRIIGRVTFAQLTKLIAYAQGEPASPSGSATLAGSGATLLGMAGTRNAGASQAGPYDDAQDKRSRHAMEVGRAPVRGS